MIFLHSKQLFFIRRYTMDFPTYFSLSKLKKKVFSLTSMKLKDNSGLSWVSESERCERRLEKGGWLKNEDSD